MIYTFVILLIFQSIGEIISYGLHLPIPGPVIGMALLFIYLLLREQEAPRLNVTVNELLRHLSLLFIPAGVGIMLHSRRIGHEWLPIVIALIGSTALTIFVTAWVIRWVEKLVNKEDSIS